MPDLKNIYPCVHKIKNKNEQFSKFKRKKKKNEMLLDSNPHLLSAKTASYPLGYRGNVLFFSFIKVIEPQSKAHILRRFPKIGRKVIEYSYVSGQCRQTIAESPPDMNIKVTAFTVSKKVLLYMYENFAYMYNENSLTLIYDRNEISKLS